MDRSCYSNRFRKDQKERCKVTAIEVATIATPVVALIVGAGQCGLIYWGLRQMSKAAESRSTQVDEICTGMRTQGKALEDMGAGIRELLNRTQPTM